MKHSPKSHPTIDLLAFGAHPDDIEFGCGGVIANETRAGRKSQLVVCSKGESASHGTPERRVREATASAKILGASLEFASLDGDAHLESSVAHSIQLARIIRRFRPTVVLAPSTVEHQHPDHPRLGGMVRDACRLARYGGVKELRPLAPHVIGQLFYYAITPQAEPGNISPVLIDISDRQVFDDWIKAMEAHASQTSAKSYVELQITRARVYGLRCGVDHAMALFPADPLMFDSLAALRRGARGF